MPILQVKIDGEWIEIPALVGKQGEKGDKGDRGAAGQGFTDEQIDLLEAVLDLATFSDTAAGQAAVESLMTSLRGTASEPDTPTETYTNLVPTSTDATGAVFNGVGYQDEARINSSGAVSTSNAAHATCTGFIKVTGGDVVRVKGGTFNVAENGGQNANSIGVYGATFNHLGTTTVGGSAYGIFGNAYADYKFASVVEETTGVYKWIVPPAASGVEYIRISCHNNGGTAPGANLIVTVNEEITD